MSIPDPDKRIAFKETIKLRGSAAIVSAAVFGGPIIRLQVGVFDDEDRLLTGIGTHALGQPLTSENGGVADWLFKVPSRAAYIKWGVQAAVSAAGLRAYSVTGKVRDENGNELVAGRFGAEIPEGKSFDDFIFDGVNVIVEKQPASMPVGARA